MPVDCQQGIRGSEIPKLVLVDAPFAQLRMVLAMVYADILCHSLFALQGPSSLTKSNTNPQSRYSV